MAPILLIKYAVAGCTAEQVTSIFNHVFGGNVVERVVTLNKVNYTTGAPFHMFFIHLTPTPTPLLDAFLSKFSTTTPVQRIMYRDPWFWNVVIAESRPRIQDAHIQHAVNQIPTWMPATLEG
jgi:hypothetical protein